jgi:hypothetical protein
MVTMILVLVHTRMQGCSDSVFVKSQELLAFKQASSCFQTIATRYSPNP